MEFENKQLVKLKEQMAKSFYDMPGCGDVDTGWIREWMEKAFELGKEDWRISPFDKIKKI